jgi:hypothetical protein
MFINGVQSLHKEQAMPNKTVQSFEQVVFAAYEDDGPATLAGLTREGEQSLRRLYVFPDWEYAQEYERALKQWSNGRKNPRVTAFYNDALAEQGLASPLVFCDPLYLAIIRNVGKVAP